MSAPDTNVEKQARRHRPAMIAIIGALAVAALLFLWLLFAVTDPETEVEAVDTGAAAATD